VSHVSHESHNAIVNGSDAVNMSSLLYRSVVKMFACA
jgi:hypothetical protein